MTDERVWKDPKAELNYLRSRTPSTRTPEIDERELALTEELISAARERLRSSYDIDGLRALLPDRGRLYALLRKVAMVRLPDEPSILASMAPDIRVALLNLQSDVNVYLSATSAALKKIDLIADRAKAYWYDWSPTEEKWKLDAEFRTHAPDLLNIQTDAQIMADDCERAYWIIKNMLGEFERDEVTT